MNQTKAFHVHAVTERDGKRFTYYSYFGLLDGWFPPSLGWRRVLVQRADGSHGIFGLFGDEVPQVLREEWQRAIT